jgi:hypothetical protein
VGDFPAYIVSTLDCQVTHLRSRKVLEDPRPLRVEDVSEEQHVIEKDGEQLQPISSTPIEYDVQHSLENKDNIVPFPERLNQPKIQPQPTFDIMGELKNLCVKIPLIQAIKDIPIYSKVIRDLCVRKPGRKKQDPPTIQVVGQLSELMLGQTVNPKYIDPGNPVVQVYIGKTPIPNTLIDLGATINIMTVEVMENLNLHNLMHQTPTILQMDDRSVVKPEGILEDIVVTIDSWEYPTYFIILHPKTNTGVIH